MTGLYVLLVVGCTVGQSLVIVWQQIKLSKAEAVIEERDATIDDMIFGRIHVLPSAQPTADEHA